MEHNRRKKLTLLDCKTDVYFNTLSLLFPLIGGRIDAWWLDPGQYYSQFKVRHPLTGLCSRRGPPFPLYHLRLGPNLFRERDSTERLSNRGPIAKETDIPCIPILSYCRGREKHHSVPRR